MQCLNLHNSGRNMNNKLIMILGLGLAVVSTTVFSGPVTGPSPVKRAVKPGPAKPVKRAVNPGPAKPVKRAVTPGPAKPVKRAVR